jgi:hypothetical protein
MPGFNASVSLPAAVIRRSVVSPANLHDLVALRMSLPSALSRELGGEDCPVAVRQQRRKRVLTRGRVGGGSSTLERSELRELGIEIDDLDHRFLHGELAVTTTKSTTPRASSDPEPQWNGS